MCRPLLLLLLLLLLRVVLLLLLLLLAGPLLILHIVLLLRRGRSVGRALNRHKVLAHERAAEQRRLRPALHSGAKRNVSFEQVDAVAAFEADAASAMRESGTQQQRCSAPEVVVAKEHEQLVGAHVALQLSVAEVGELTRGVLRRVSAKKQHERQRLCYLHPLPNAGACSRFSSRQQPWPSMLLSTSRSSWRCNSSAAPRSTMFIIRLCSSSSSRRLRLLRSMTGATITQADAIQLLLQLWRIMQRIPPFNFTFCLPRSCNTARTIRGRRGGASAERVKQCEHSLFTARQQKR